MAGVSPDLNSFWGLGCGTWACRAVCGLVGSSLSSGSVDTGVAEPPGEPPRAVTVGSCPSTRMGEEALLESLSSDRLLGRILRWPLQWLPPDTPMPVLWGPLAGARWIAGAGIHRCWLGTYEREKAMLFAKAVKASYGAVWDIGAHAGYFSLIAAKYSPHVVAVEPLPTNIRFLQRHLEINNVENVSIVEAAIAAQSGQADFEMDGTYMGHVSTSALHRENILRIEATSLDDLLRHYDVPAVIKMDIEGGEIAALKGADRLLSAPTIWFIATHGFWAKQETLRLLRERRYKITEITHDELVARPAGG